LFVVVEVLPLKLACQVLEVAAARARQEDKCTTTRKKYFFHLFLIRMLWLGLPFNKSQPASDAALRGIGPRISGTDYEWKGVSFTQRRDIF